MAEPTKAAKSAKPTAAATSPTKSTKPTTPAERVLAGDLPFAKEEFVALLSRTLREEGLLTPEVSPLSEGALVEAFALLTARLLTVGAHMNLTAIRDLPGICLKHYADCLKLSPLLPRGCALLDVGCGGGFPTLPLAIARPDLQLTALDATAKKLRFVAETAALLRRPVAVLHARAEDAAHDDRYRERFDVVTARAVAALSQLIAWCFPFVKPGGFFLAMKGAGGDAELTEAAPEIARYGGTVERVISFRLGTSTGDPLERRIFCIRKVRATDPRLPPRRGR